MAGVLLNIDLNFGILNILPLAPILSDQYKQGPFEVAFTRMAITRKTGDNKKSPPLATIMSRIRLGKGRQEGFIMALFKILLLRQN